MPKALLCIATSHDQARSITQSLKSAGFNHDDISVLLADNAETSEFAHEQDTRAPEGAEDVSCSGETLVETSASRQRSAREDATRLPLG